MIHLKNIVIPIAVFTLAGSASVYSSDSLEEPTLGIRYMLTDEMSDAGINLFTDGLSTLNNVGELDVNYEDEIMEVVLVMKQDTYDNFTEDQNAEEYYKSSFPEYDISSEPKDDYVYVYLDFSPTLDMTEEGLSEAYNLGQELISSFEYIPVEAEVIPVSLDSPLVFDTLNLDGEQVTDTILAEKDITILNIWASYCNPCINEMPELAAWEQELPENVQLLYLCSDLTSLDSDDKDLVDIIVNKSKINRKNVLLLTDGLLSELSPFLYAVPITIFIDKDGNLYDKIVAGAYIDQYKEAVQELSEKQ